MKEFHGRTGSPLYASYKAMKKRCHDKNDADYCRYGARGIEVCEEWRNSFSAFLRDMGERPEGKELDRIDNSKGYFKENCRWVTHKTNCRNRKTNKIIVYNGVSKNITEWAEETGIKVRVLCHRLNSKKLDY